MYLSSVYIILGVIVITASDQIPQQFTQNPCLSKKSCHECIETPSCAWCYDTINTTIRCFQQSYPLPPLDQCKLIFNPDNVIFPISDVMLSSRVSGQGGSGGAIVTGAEINTATSETNEARAKVQGAAGAKGGAASRIVQIKPQRIQLKLRAKQTYSVSMYYTQAEDYPVDLYYLMDLSKSMEDDKEKLSALGDHLAKTMKKMTSKFTLGFGSFVDKVVMPYVSTIPEKLLHPCSGCVAPYGFRNHMALSTNTSSFSVLELVYGYSLISPCPGCKAPYGFRNMLPLSQNTDLFSQMVENASVSGNLDAPEGGFDAIMQAVVCRQIGWRKEARHLLVFSTDAAFHYAGDGKLGGIVKPNDGNCHLSRDGYYTESSKQDYPSISQISTYVKNNAINVIFAVTADKIGIYKQLQTHIEGSSCGQLSNDSSNIVDLIKEQYEAISSTVELKHNASSAVNIKFFTKCLSKNGEMIETNKCGNIKVGNLVEFRVQLEVLKCPADRKDWLQTIEIKPVGMTENLTIDLEMLCDCPCERPGQPFYKENADQCKGAGTLKCGICDCNPGSYGSFCECTSKNQTISKVTAANCINKKNGLECSGRGSCSCGECVCEKRNIQTELIYGDTCECDNFSCERHNGLICSGPQHGYCDCGECKCTQEWTGGNCACRNSTDACYPDDANKDQVCSGNGVCECNACKCNVTEEGRYFGKFCEHCPNCKDDCDKHKPCVQCLMYKNGDLTEKQCEECKFVPFGEDVIVANEENNEILCTYYDENDCRFAFVYYFNDNKTVAVRAQKELECPPKVFLLGIVLGVIAAVVLLGLAVLLLWKLFTTIHDRREFAKFEKETMMARWDTGENPIYKQATSTFKNPTYAGKS